MFSNLKIYEPDEGHMLKHTELRMKLFLYTTIVAGVLASINLKFSPRKWAC